MFLVPSINLQQYMWFYLDLSFLQTSYYTVMGEFLFHAYSNLGDYLSISLSSFIKKGLYKMKNHGMDLKQVNHPTEYSQWQNIPVDMMESIVKQIKATDRVRLSCVCKSWRQMLVLYKDIWITAPDIPWLLLPHSRDRKSLSFYSMSEGRVYNMKWPKPAHGGWVCGYSNGWLAIVKGSDLHPRMFLLNPVSGEQLNLPSPTTVDPYYDHFIDRALDHFNAFNFVYRVEVFFPCDASDCIVAAIFGFCQVLAFCRPGDKRWSIFREVGNDVAGFEYGDILFYDKSLYVATNLLADSLSTHDIVLADCKVKLKLIPCHILNGIDPVWDNVENQRGLVISKDVVGVTYLAKSIHGELLMIYQINDIFAINTTGLLDIVEWGNYQIAEENRGIEGMYYQTKGFEILKVNPNNGHCDKLTSLGEQVLFLAAGGGSLAISVKNMEGDGFKGNCLYFAATSCQKFSQHIINISRESGVFYLEDGRIERCFPSITFPVHSQMSWFTPISW